MIKKCLLFLFWIALNSCKNDPAAVDPFIKSGAFLRETGTDVTVIYRDSGKIKAVIKAPEVVTVHVANAYTEMTKGMKAVFYNQYEEKNALLRANYARRYQQTQLMIASGDVVLVNTAGDTLKAQELEWNQKINKLSTDKPVQIRKKDLLIFGDGLESNQDFTKYKILHIRGTVTMK